MTLHIVQHSDKRVQHSDIAELQGEDFWRVSGNFLVRLEPLWPVLGLLVVTVGFYGSAFIVEKLIV